MGSKIVGFLAIFLVMVVLISSEVAAARELIDPTNDRASDKASETVHPDQAYGYGMPSTPTYPTPTPPTPTFGSGNYCKYGCCGYGYYPQTCQCCEDSIAADTP